MTFNHPIKIAVCAIFLLQISLSNASEEMNPPPASTIKYIAGKHIRISAQVLLPELRDQLKNITIKLPNGKKLPLDLVNEFQGRIPVCDFYPFKRRTKMTLNLIGDNHYAGCHDRVLFQNRGSDTTYPEMQEKDGSVVVAIRIQIEKRLATTLPDGTRLPEFLRARAICRYAPPESTTLPIYNGVIVNEFTLLAPPHTFANDAELLQKVLTKNKFVRQEQITRYKKYITNTTRQKESVLDDNIPDDLEGNITFVIGEYIRHATAQYGAPERATSLLLINFFVQSHLIDRTEAPLALEMLGLEGG